MFLSCPSDAIPVSTFSHFLWDTLYIGVLQSVFQQKLLVFITFYRKLLYLCILNVLPLLKFILNVYMLKFMMKTQAVLGCNNCFVYCSHVRPAARASSAATISQHRL